ncbi:MAG: c-type cytochrome biogenesis protein CcsB [Nakamurella sp.]
MAVSSSLGAFSDQAFGAATAAYTVALICTAVEFSSRRIAARTDRSADLVGAGALTRDGRPDGVPIVPTAGPYGHVASTPATAIPWGERFGRAGLAVAVLGFLAQLASIVTRGFAAGRLPLGNMYEFTSAISAAVIGTFLVVKIKNRDLPIGVFVLVPITLLMYVNGTVLHVAVAELQPALNSYWKWIHVTTVSLSSGVLMFSGIASLLYVLRHRFEARGSDATSVWAKLPSLERIDRIAYRTAILAFPVYTFAVITGALWAEVAWGRYWNWDPKETWAFITWVIYAGYLHARATAGWRGTKSAWISVIGLVSIVFNLFFINMVIAGLHSYAGLN